MIRVLSLTILGILLVSTSIHAKNYQTVEWIDLLPPEDLEALSNPPSNLASITDEEASIEDFTKSVGQAIADSISPFDMESTPYYQALVSTKVVEQFNGKDIRIPGFIVPLEFNDDMRVTEFFLVPFFGACIHYPPPPPNQIIHTKYPKGITIQALYDPFWVEGTITTSLQENEMATSTYALDASNITIYEYEELNQSLQAVGTPVILNAVAGNYPFNACISAVLGGQGSSKGRTQTKQILHYVQGDYYFVVFESN